MAASDIHTCPQCQAEILYTVQFCPNCGNWLGAQTPGGQAAQREGDRSAPEEARDPLQPERQWTAPAQNEQDFVVQVVNQQALCPHCGQLHPESMVYCPVTTLSIRDSERLCPNCGAGVSPTASFCPECGRSIKASDHSQHATRPDEAAQADIYATQQMAYTAPAMGTAYPETGTGSARGSRSRYIWLLAAGGGLVILCLLCVGIVFSSNIESILGVFASPTPQATFTSAPTATTISTNTAAPSPSATQALPPTLTYTPEPSDTPSPTDTPRPTDTPSETVYYWVKIRNNFAALVFAFRNDKQMGRDPIPLGKYIQYKVPAGTHTFYVCLADSNTCSKDKTVTVDSDLEVVFP